MFIQGPKDLKSISFAGRRDTTVFLKKKKKEEKKQLVFPFKNHVASIKYMILKNKKSHHRHISFSLPVIHSKKRKRLWFHFWMKSIHRWKNVREA